MILAVMNLIDERTGQINIACIAGILLQKVTYICSAHVGTVYLGAILDGYWKGMARGEKRFS